MLICANLAVRAISSLWQTSEDATDRKDGSLVLSYYENGSEACYTSEYQWFADDGSGDQAADTSSATSLIGVVNSVAWQSCVTTADDGTVDYGLGDPTLSVSMEYTTETEVETGDVDEDGDAIYETRIEEHAYTLIVGNAADGGGYYAQPEGSSAVYTLSDDDVAELLDATAASLAPDDVCLMDWSTVDSIDASWDGGSCTITFVRDTTVEDADGGSSEGSDESADDGTESTDGESSDESDAETTYRIGGEDADTDAVEEVLSAIDALTAEGTGSIADAQEQTATLTFVIHRNTNTFAEMELSFTRYDNNFYLVSFSGSQKQLVSRTDIGEIEDLLDALASS